MLEVLWKATEAEGYTDLIPISWLAQEGYKGMSCTKFLDLASDGIGLIVLC